MICRRTLTGHKDDVTSLSAITLTRHYASMIQKRRSTNGGGGSGGGAAGKDGSSNNRLVLPCSVVASASADGTVRLW